MNFLAHCALASDAASSWGCSAEARQALLAGAVLGDFVKGPVPPAWPKDLRAGVMLHRRIDGLSGQDPDLRALFPLFGKALRRYAPIFVDLLCDYALSRQWTTFHTAGLKPFSQECYVALAHYNAYLPEHGQRFAQYLAQEDLLSNYHQWHHVQRGTHSVLRRLGKTELREPADQVMSTLVGETERAMAGAYPRMRATWQSWQPAEYASTDEVPKH